MALRVSGSGDANIRASRMALSSALVTLVSPPLSSPNVSSLSSLTMCLRLPDWVRSIRRPRTLVDANRPETGGLEHPHQLQTNHFEQREKRHDQEPPVVWT